MTTPHGERMKLTYRLAPRERRALTAKLSAAQDALEAAIDAREEVIREVWGKGVPLADIVTVTGMGRNAVIKTLGDSYVS